MTTTLVIALLAVSAFAYAEYKYPKFVSEIVAKVEDVYLHVATVVTALFKKKAVVTPVTTPAVTPTPSVTVAAK